MEKQSRSYANDDWRDFKKGLAQAKTRFNHERRMLEMYAKAFDAEYLTIKLENQYRDR